MPANICQLVTHTHKWTSTSSCRRVSRPICARGTHGHLGGGSVSFIYRGRVLSMNATFVNGLFNNEASFGASIHPGLLLSDVPSANVNNKRQSGIIRPPDAWGVFLFNHVCVMNAAALNHCLFIMSPKCSCNGGFNVATALPEVLCVCMYVIEEIEMVSALITQGQWPLCWLDTVTMLWQGLRSHWIDHHPGISTLCSHEYGKWKFSPEHLRYIVKC